jgi:DNA-directed RNA polymerase subunit omega
MLSFLRIVDRLLRTHRKLGHAGELKSSEPACLGPIGSPQRASSASMSLSRIAASKLHLPGRQGTGATRALPGSGVHPMRDDYLEKARGVIPDVYILVNVVSRRVKQLRRGARPLIESLEKLALEDVALREIAEGRISYEIADVTSDPTETPLGARPLVKLDTRRLHSAGRA